LKRKVKVLHIIDHLGSGGAQEIVLDLARYLDHAEFDLQVWCLHGYGSYFNELRALGIPVKSLSRWKFNPFIPLSLWYGLRKEQFDILNLHLSFSTFLGGVLGRLAGVSKIVVTIHALKNQSRLWVFPMWGLLSSLYDKFIAEVAYSVKELRESGIASEKIAFIRLGTKKAVVDSDVSDAPLSVGHWAVNGENPILLNIARLHEHKGQIYLIRAMESVIQQMPAAKLLIVGDGPLEAVLETEIKRLHLENSVFLLGFRRDLEALYSSCDVFVMPSVHEGMGVAIIQAMAYEKPVIASDVGAIPEAVRPGETGVLVPPGDPAALALAILDLLGNPERLHCLGKQAQAFVREEFLLGNMIRGYTALYRSLSA